MASGSNPEDLCGILSACLPSAAGPGPIAPGEGHARAHGFLAINLDFRSAPMTKPSGGCLQCPVTSW